MVHSVHIAGESDELVTPRPCTHDQYMHAALEAY